MSETQNSNEKEDLSNHSYDSHDIELKEDTPKDSLYNPLDLSDPLSLSLFTAMFIK